MPLQKHQSVSTVDPYTLASVAERVQGKGGCVRHVTINDLSKCCISIVPQNIKAEGLDAGRVHRMPLHVVSLEFGVGSFLRLLSNRADRGGTINRLFRAGHIGQS